MELAVTHYSERLTFLFFSLNTDVVLRLGIPKGFLNCRDYQIHFIANYLINILKSFQRKVLDKQLNNEDGLYS